jgi:hypothetical protein
MYPAKRMAIYFAVAMQNGYDVDFDTGKVTESKKKPSDDQVS